MNDSNIYRLLEQRYVDAAFPLRGGGTATIPIDHGYPLLGAIARVLPAMHRQKHWAIAPVLGDYRGHGALALTARSRLKIRLPADEVSEILDLSGKALDIAGTTCRLGFPKLAPLESPPHVKARLVVIKGFDEPEPFVAALRRQIAALPGLGQDPERIEIQLGPRRVLRIKGTPIAGFAVALTGLEADASLVIQKFGLGGRRHMGAGVFLRPRRSA